MRSHLTTIRQKDVIETARILRLVCGRTEYDTISKNSQST